MTTFARVSNVKPGKIGRQVLRETISRKTCLPICFFCGKRQVFLPFTTVPQQVETHMQKSYNLKIYSTTFQSDLLYLQDWFAFVGNGSEFNFTLSGEADFPNSGTPTAEDNYGFCQVSVIDSCRSHQLLALFANLIANSNLYEYLSDIKTRNIFVLFLFFLQEVQFNTTFYASPVVLVSVHHFYNPQISMKSLVPPENNIISAWVEVNMSSS